MDRHEALLENDTLFRLTEQYVKGRERGDPAILATLVARHPQYAELLIEFATAHFSMLEAPFTGIDASPQDLRIEHRVLQAAFDDLRMASFRGIAEEVQRRGLPLALLANKIEIGKDVLEKLDAGRIVVESVPDALLARLAMFLPLSAAQLRAALGHRAAAASNAGGGPETFATAIRSSKAMQGYQRAAWLPEAGETAAGEAETEW